MMYRGIIHVHSTHSYDGKLSLPELKSLLRANGLSFACMTEHTDRLTKEAADSFVAECRALSDETFLFLPGFEVPYKKAHVLHIGATDFQTAVAEDGHALAAWRAVTPLVVLAHPVRNQYVVDDALLASLDGVEIWNQQYEGKYAPRCRSAALLCTLRQKKSLIATGGVDLHRADHLGSPVTEVVIASLKPGALLEALAAGAYVFGHEKVQVAGLGDWRPSIGERFLSKVSIIVIALGKAANALLARLGIRLPKKIVRAIRARV